MDVLEQIDWLNHDGVNLDMINDFVRNQFYDRILVRYVAGQDCTDIGFGTGLLSMLALKHGARHIRAYESNHDRYQLGIEIIKQLKLQHQIELINERYDHNYQPSSITFTETVSGNLWGEGLWYSLPRDDKTVFLPGEYFLELWAVEVPDSFAQGLCVTAQTKEFFAPGVDVDPSFISVVNSLAKKTVSSIPLLHPGIVKFTRQQQTIWNWIPYMRAVQAGGPVASYTVSNWLDGVDKFTLSVPTGTWKNSTVLVVPRCGMKQDLHKLYLDTGHWGPGEDPILLVKPQGTLVVKHSVRNGLITYSLE